MHRECMLFVLTNCKETTKLLRNNTEVIFTVISKLSPEHTDAIVRNANSAPVWSDSQAYVDPPQRNRRNSLNSQDMKSKTTIERYVYSMWCV